MLVEKLTTASTNDDARDLALGGAPHGAAVFARHQTEGRGRAGRRFESAEGGLYLSVILRPASPPAEWGLLPLAAGVAVAGVLRDHGFDALVKWPNDIMLAGHGLGGIRKLGGILVESRLDASPFAVVGVGLNLGAAPLGVPEATSLAEHGRVLPVEAIAMALRAALLEEWRALERNGPARTLARLDALCATLGREVAWDGGVGRAVAIAEDGALVVESAGQRHRVVAGDARLVQKE